MSTFGLMGLPLAAGVTLLALLVPLLAAAWFSQRPRRGPARAVGLLVCVVLAQLLAVGGVFLWVNRSFDFYVSWGDLLGRTSTDTGITVQSTPAPDHSRTEVLPIRTSSGTTTQALVWLPRQYDEAAYAHRRFPVVELLPGQPSTPNALYQKFEAGQVAAQEIDSGRVQPFVMVVPPLMTAPPRDTECTDVPGGPQAETFLSRDVPRAVEQHLRVQPLGRAWTLAGWSTGGFCAAKIGLAHPGDYHSLVSFGGYFTPITDDTTGDLFHGRTRLEDRNSPLWLYRHHGTGGTRLLLVAGEQDRESWPETRRMIEASAGDPSVAYVAFPQGGHNFHNYRSYLGRALQWAEIPAPTRP